MGKALIVSGGTDGAYTIKPLHNRERIDAETAAIENRLEEIAPELEEVTEAFEFAELEVAEAKMYADALIDRLEEEGALPPVDLVELVQLHNSARSGAGALAAVDKLNSAAQAHADDLAANNITGHFGSTGSTLRQRVTSVGYSGTVGENVAWGQSSSEAAVNAWMLSPGHRRNILRPEFQHIGVGYACRPDGYRHFWVAVFGEDGAASTQSPAAPSNCVGEDGDIPELIQEAIEDLARASAARDRIKIDRELLVASQLSLSQRLAALQQIPADANQAAWCADYTESLTGEVATAEIPGEGKARIIVRPGYDGRATYVAARDGQLFHRAGQSPEQAYFNAAILPGVQKWKPTYRVGVLTAVNDLADTCSLTLDYELSSAYDLPINQAATLTGVPIEYMDCDADVFAVNDRVLVQFQGQDWGSPKVIGFESTPKECQAEWPDELHFRVWLNGLDDDGTVDSSFAFLYPTNAGTIYTDRVLDGGSGCCGWVNVRTANPNLARRSLSYGGPGGIDAKTGATIAALDASFSLDSAAEFDGSDVTAAKVPIDFLYENTDSMGSNNYAPTYYNEKFEATATMQFVDASAMLVSHETQNILWRQTIVTGYEQITIPGWSSCTDSRLLWVGTNRDGSTRKTGDITRVDDATCLEFRHDLTETQTTWITSPVFSGTSPEYSNAQEMAIDYGKIAGTITLYSGAQTNTYIASGMTRGTSSQAYMRYVRSDLVGP